MAVLHSAAILWLQYYFRDLAEQKQLVRTLIIQLSWAFLQVMQSLCFHSDI